MLSQLGGVLLVLQLALAFDIPPLRNDFTQTKFSNYKAITSAITSKAVTAFNKGTNIKQQYAALEQFKTAAASADKTKVQAIVMQLMDYRQTLVNIKGGAIQIFGKALTQDIINKIDAKIVTFDAKYKGDWSLFTNDVMTYMQTLLPPTKYKTQYAALNTAMQKSNIANVLAFSHWDGKSTNIYFLKPGYKRTAQPWEKQI